MGERVNEESVRRHSFNFLITMNRLSRNRLNTLGFFFSILSYFVIELIEEVSITMKCKNIVRFARNEKHLLGNLYKLDCVVFRIGEWK